MPQDTGASIVLDADEFPATIDVAELSLVVDPANVKQLFVHQTPWPFASRYCCLVVAILINMGLLIDG
jgi:hypothetical protein